VMQKLERDVFFYTTFGGEALSLAAAAATIPELRRREVPQTLAARGRTLRDGYAQICRELGIAWTRCAGMDARTLVVFDASAVDPLLARSYVQQELIRRGVLWSGFHNLSWAHRDSDLAYLLGCYREILPALAGHITAGTLASALRGRPVEPVFRRLALSWGVEPLLADLSGDLDVAARRVGATLTERGVVPAGSSVVLVSMSPELGSGPSNFLKLQKV